jgi:preprotein translocase subunit SecD
MDTRQDAPHERKSALKMLSWKPALVVAVIIAAVIFVLPTVHMRLTATPQPTLWPKKKINLGLDLQGGMHLVLEVETEKAVESTIERLVQELRSQLRTDQIAYADLKQVDGSRIAAQLQGQENIAKFEALLDKEFQDLRIASRKVADDTLDIVLDLPDEEAARIRKMATEQALETIRNRIDQFGVSEPDIRIQGEKRILIQLPGVKDTQRAKDLIGRTALLEFKLVDDAHSVEEAVQGRLFPGSELLYEISENRETRRTSKVPFLVQKRAALTGAYLTDAVVQIDSQYNEPYVSITFDKKGARLFERVTAENVNKRLAIVLDNNVYSAPVIQEKIAGGQARITGSFTAEEARDLAIVLRAGALPAPVTVIEERTVGPSLGTDSIQKGLVSMIVGLIVVGIFMAAYYRLSGIVANFALLLNILLIAGGLAAFQATLTLPGIAGIILTIGMAVDANVLIFERIREEITIGKTHRAAVDAGFERATLTILDANVTTLIAALVLFQFGTGPVKGFAVTLSLGVIASLFTALILTRLIFDYFLLTRKVKTLSI